MSTSPLTVEALVDWLTRRISAYAHIPVGAIPIDAPLSDLALDSAFVLTLCTDLEQQLGLLVEPTIAWDYPTVEAIAGHLAALAATTQTGDQSTDRGIA